MTARDFVLKLMDYYKSSYSEERVAQLTKFSSNVPTSELERLFDAITEERSANTAITVADIKEACSRVGVSFRHSEYIADIKVECDACGESYRYAPAPTDEAIERGIHSRCPNCGFQYGWTKSMLEYAEHGIRPEWYDRYLASFRDNGYGTGKPRGRWYNKLKDDAAVAAGKKAMIDERVERIRRSMALDTSGGAL